MNNAVVFYKDSVDVFECDIKIDGASSSKTKARLVLEFQNRTLLFNGSISNGHVSVKIPKLSDIDESTGNATLEVIAEQTFFEAWKAPFDLRNKKNVRVNEVRVNNSKKTIMAEVKNVSKGPEKKQTRKPSILKENCSDKNADYVSESFDMFSSLKPKEKNQVKRELREFQPKRLIREWADNVFEDSSTTYAKYCMMRLQKGSKR